MDKNDEGVKVDFVVAYINKNEAKISVSQPFSVLLLIKEFLKLPKLPEVMNW
jgi:hypothetical protein